MTLTIKSNYSYVLLIAAFLCCNSLVAQQNYFEDKRGKNVISPSAGSSFINGDYANPKYENYGQLGFKRFINSHVNLNLNYRKFNLDSKSLFDNGFMAFDLNIEYYVFPEKSFSPYVFLGGGMILSNEFKDPNNKIQAGFGLEYLFSRQIGLTLMTNGNYHFINEIDPLIYPDVDEFYLSAGIGLNFYFDSIFNKTRSKQKLAKTTKSEATVINSNPIIPHKNEDKL